MYKEISDNSGISYETVHTYIRRNLRKAAGPHPHGTWQNFLRGLNRISTDLFIFKSFAM